MKRFMKTGLAATFLAVTLLLSTISVWAATTYTEGYFNYIIEEESITITYYKGSASEVTVPNSLVGYPVSKLAAGSFSKCTTLRKLNLPDTIVEIEEGALPQGITVVYDSNTDTPQSSGVAEEDVKKENSNTVSSENNAMSNDTSNTTSDSKEETSDFSIEVVEVTDDMETGESSGINLDELNASVKNADTAMDKTETDKSFESDSKKITKAEGSTAGEEKDSEEAVSEQEKESAEAEEDAEVKVEKDAETPSNEKQDETSKKISEKKDTKDTETASDDKSTSETETSTEGSSWTMVLVIVLAVIIGAVYFKKKNKK